MPKSSSGLVFVVFASVFNVLLAVLFSKNGYEAFITVSVALGILFTLQSIHTARLAFKTQAWLVAKLLCVPAIALIWFMVVTGVMLTMPNSTYRPNVHIPDINWWLVCIGTLPYLLPRLNALRSNDSLKYSLVHMTTVIYSALVLLIASVDFYSSDPFSHNIILVLAVQLQYLMNYILLKTDYIHTSLAFSNNLVAQLRLTGNNFGSYLIVAIVGLPFLIPLAVVLALQLN